MLPIYLTAEELKGITGYVTAAAQIRWLRLNRFFYVVRADGKPLVSRDHFQLRMGGLITPEQINAFEPDFRSLQ